MFSLTIEENKILADELLNHDVTPIKHENGERTRKDCGSDCRGKCGATCQAVCKSTCSSLF